VTPEINALATLMIAVVAVAVGGATWVMARSRKKG
jgi:ABC-type spermidine/putrescine transport system permease subunit II